MKTRYGYGGTVETTAVGTGLWTRRDIQSALKDITVTVTAQTAARPSMIAYSVYGKDGLLWLVLQYNNIIDPIAELVVGKVLKLPHPSIIL